MKPISERTTIGEILEITSMDVELAKANYKRLIKIYHPDVNKTQEAAEYSKKLNWAIGIVTGKIKHVPKPPPPPPQQRTIIFTMDFGNGFSGTQYTWTSTGSNDWWSF